MDAPRQAPDPVELIGHALGALRRGGSARRGEHEHGGGPAAARGGHHRGGAPAGGGHGGAGHGGGGHGGPHGRGHENPLHRAARLRLMEALERIPGGASVSELAEAIAVDQPRASRLVMEATERGLVARSTDPRDARRSVVTLTDSGRDMLAAVRAQRRDAVENALAGFTPAEREQLAELLTRFAEAWRR